MTAIDIDAEKEELTELLMDTAQYSRLPVYEDSIDNIIGILSLNRYYKATLQEENPDIRSLLLPTCKLHKTMKLPAALTVIEEEAFYGSAAGYVIIPSGVTSIGDSAFASMPNLQLISIPSTVTSFGANCLNSDSTAILCEEGSAAESYAVQEGIPYFIVK